MKKINYIQWERLEFPPLLHFLLLFLPFVPLTAELHNEGLSEPSVPVEQLQGSLGRFSICQKKMRKKKHCCMVCGLICARQKHVLTRQSDERLAFHPTCQQPVQHRWTALLLKPGEECHQLGHWRMCTQVLQTQHLQWHKKITVLSMKFQFIN